MEMKDLLKQGITEALNKAIAAGTLPAGDYPDVALEVPPQKEFGDFASNIAMQSARVAHKAPRLIAQAIVDGMDYPWLDHVEIAGAGFINFFLKNDVIYDTLKQILAAGDAYGHAPLRKEDTIQVEYVSANPTGRSTSATAAAPLMAVPWSISCGLRAITSRPNTTLTTPATR